MYELYLPLVQNPNPDAVIKVENITGPIMLISSRMDTMWPSELAAKAIIRRLEEHGFPYEYRHLSYEHGSHLFVPMEMPSAKFFKGERGRNKEGGRKDRMDSLEKTLEFVSRWYNIYPNMSKKLPKNCALKPDNRAAGELEGARPASNQINRRRKPWCIKAFGNSILNAFKMLGGKRGQKSPHRTFLTSSKRCTAKRPCTFCCNVVFLPLRRGLACGTPM